MQRCFSGFYGFYPPDKNLALLGFSGFYPKDKNLTPEKNHGHTANQKNQTRVYFLVY
jgi:hypothetical protein